MIFGFKQQQQQVFVLKNQKSFLFLKKKIFGFKQQQQQQQQVFVLKNQKSFLFLKKRFLDSNNNRLLFLKIKKVFEL